VKVRFTAVAEGDLRDLRRYLLQSAGPQVAREVLGRLRDAARSLDQLPERGNVPPELTDIVELRYRELHVRPYRLIDEVTADAVLIHVIADGRRDLRALLERRLLRA
jgi:toxin ParE1/3/4